MIIRRKAGFKQRWAKNNWVRKISSKGPVVGKGGAQAITVLPQQGSFVGKRVVPMTRDDHTAGNRDMVNFREVRSFFWLARVLVLLFLGSLGISDLRAGTIQWTVAEGGNGDWYDLVMPDSYQYSYSWTQARAAADSMTWLGLQGYLATVTSPGESEFLRDNFSSQLFDNGPLNIGVGPTDSKYAWIGLFAPTQTSGFQWVTGEPVNFTDWAPSEPNSFGTPYWQFVHYWTRDFGSGPSWTWNNEQNGGFGVQSNQNTYGFFVEFGGGQDLGVPVASSVPEPSSAVILGFGLVVIAFLGLRRPVEIQRLQRNQ
jgi:hypothetical protein